MKQTITFHDKRKHTKNRQKDQDLNLKVEMNAKTITVTLEREDGKSQTYTFKTCTFPPKNSETDRSSWFDHVETVASDAPLEYSGEHFSVCDLLADLTADDDAFRILADALYSMSGLKMTKPLAAMLGDRTLMELVSALDTPVRNDSSPDTPARNDCAPDTPGDSGAGRKTPENALQILNAELNKISKR